MQEKHTWGFVLALVLVATVSLPAQQPPSAIAEPEAPTQGEPGPSGFPSASVLRLIRFSGAARGVQGQPLAGTVGVTFALYEEQEGGAPLWLETQNVVPDNQGRYIVLLGATSNEGLPLEVFTSGEARWLGIQVQGQAEQRVLLVSVPYALKAAEAETLSGKTASDFLLSEQLSAQVEEEINSQIEQQGLVTTEEASTLAQVSGSGTVGRIAKFTSPTAVGNSVITEKNGNIGIGLINPNQKLAVGVGAAGGKALNLTNQNNQDLQVVLSAAGAGDRVALVAPSTPTNLALGVGAQEKMRITNAGKVGIGVKNPQQPLVVASTGGATVNVTNRADQDFRVTLSTPGAGDKVALIGSGTPTNLALGVGNAEKMRITNAGNVGIGTSTPFARLEVLDTANNVSVKSVAGTSASGLASVRPIGAWGDNTGSGPGLLATNSDSEPALEVQNRTSGNGFLIAAFDEVDVPRFTVDMDGNMIATGTKSAAVPLAAGRRVAMFAMESPENWFEDFGYGQLSRGEATITLDSRFGQTVNTAVGYHVFLTPNGECNALYVAEKTSDSFTVRESGGGQSTVAFDYRIVARRKGYETTRLPELRVGVQLPTPSSARRLKTQ